MAVYQQNKNDKQNWPRILNWSHIDYKHTTLKLLAWIVGPYIVLDKTYF